MLIEERHHHSHSTSHHHHRRHGSGHHHHGKNDKQRAANDPAYPEQRLEAILNGLEDRLQAGKETLYKLQTNRNDMEYRLHGLQEEKVVLDQSLSDAKHGEALVREKERQINEEFTELLDERRKSDPNPFIKRTLILGRELFSLLLRDVGIEDTSRKAFEARVARIGNETTLKANERTDLQQRVLLLQKDCEAELEHKREIYDEIHSLQKRSESLDAQISMLTEWRKSLENQIISVRAAIKKRQNVVSDPIATPSKDKGNGDAASTLQQSTMADSLKEMGNGDAASILQKSYVDNVAEVEEDGNEEMVSNEVNSPTKLEKSTVLILTDGEDVLPLMEVDDEDMIPLMEVPLLQILEPVSSISSESCVASRSASIFTVVTDMTQEASSSTSMVSTDSTASSENSLTHISSVASICFDSALNDSTIAHFMQSENVPAELEHYMAFEEPNTTVAPFLQRRHVPTPGNEIQKGIQYFTCLLCLSTIGIILLIVNSYGFNGLWGVLIGCLSLFVFNWFVVYGSGLP